MRNATKHVPNTFGSNSHIVGVAGRVDMQFAADVFGLALGRASTRQLQIFADQLDKVSVLDAQANNGRVLGHKTLANIVNQIFVTMLSGGKLWAIERIAQATLESGLVQGLAQLDVRTIVEDGQLRLNTLQVVGQFPWLESRTCDGVEKHASVLVKYFGIALCFQKIGNRIPSADHRKAATKVFDIASDAKSAVAFGGKSSRRSKCMGDAKLLDWLVARTRTNGDTQPRDWLAIVGRGDRHTRGQAGDLQLSTRGRLRGGRMRGQVTLERCTTKRLNILAQHF